MKVKIKKLDEKVKTPHYSTDGAAGLDIYAHTIKYVYEDDTKHQYTLDRLKYIEMGTGLSIEIPEGYVGLLFPRSSVTNKDLMLGNAVGMIDSDYRGEITFRFKRLRLYSTDEYKVGEKIGQLLIVPYPKVELEVSHELSDTQRGSGGYGSTGR